MGGIFLFGAQTVEPERWVSGVPPEFLLWVPQMLGAGSRVVPPEAGGKELEICPGAGVEELAAAGRGAEGTPTPPACLRVWLSSSLRAPNLCWLLEQMVSPHRKLLPTWNP